MKLRELEPDYSRNLPFGIRWYVDRKAKHKFFATDQERQKWKTKFQRDLLKHGANSLKVDPHRLKRWERADAIIGDADPVEVAEFWIRNRRTAQSKVTWNALEK
ncbi:hypothetical protein [Cerasicoccus arenae]|uniref:Uncharacterized protein n=1 Tax=Cerasicoccus arenae TaxID=424488 RepID=A0A8J3GFQ3_9BACT|nr:hypothetical protein [Cerasicoccus arenae]MBK1860039.1 hypothetical protein [Cerasicoccus arenae]GHC13917.1 hypothetical protein GCM10007047_34030 [Cerasicoccus arenae]